MGPIPLSEPYLGKVPSGTEHLAYLFYRFALFIQGVPERSIRSKLLFSTIEGAFGQKVNDIRIFRGYYPS